MSNNQVIEGNLEMRDYAKRHFQKLYEEDVSWRPKLHNLHFKTSGEESQVNVEKMFTEEEIYDPLKSCNRYKAPGSNGFNM